MKWGNDSDLMNGEIPQFKQELFDQHLEEALKIGKSFNIPGLDQRACEHEARVGLWKAVEAHTDQIESFDQFAKTVVRNYLKSVYNQESKARAAFGFHDECEPNDGSNFSSPTGQPAAPDAIPSLAAEHNEIRASLKTGLDSLTLEQRHVLQEISTGRSYVSIALQLGVTPQAVRQMCQRGASQMRSILESQGIGSAKYLPQPHSSIKELDFPAFAEKKPHETGKSLAISVIGIFIFILLALLLGISR